MIASVGLARRGDGGRILLDWLWGWEVVWWVLFVLRGWKIGPRTESGVTVMV